MGAKKKEPSIKTKKRQQTKAKNLSKTGPNVRRSLRNTLSNPLPTPIKKKVKKVAVKKAVAKRKVKTPLKKQKLKNPVGRKPKQQVKIFSLITKQGKSFPEPATPTKAKNKINKTPTLKSPKLSLKQNKVPKKTKNDQKAATNPRRSGRINKLNESTISNESTQKKSPNKRISNRLRSQQNETNQQTLVEEQQKSIKIEDIQNDIPSTSETVQLITHSNNSEINTNSSPILEPVKIVKRGRPRKVVVVEKIEPTPIASPPPPPRIPLKRGRPPKKKNLNSSVVSIASVNLPINEAIQVEDQIVDTQNVSNAEILNDESQANEKSTTVFVREVNNNLETSSEKEIFNDKPESESETPTIIAEVNCLPLTLIIDKNTLAKNGVVEEEQKEEIERESLEVEQKEEHEKESLQQNEEIESKNEEIEEQVQQNEEIESKNEEIEEQVQQDEEIEIKNEERLISKENDVESYSQLEKDENVGSINQCSQPVETNEANIEESNDDSTSPQPNVRSQEKPKMRQNPTRSSIIRETFNAFVLQTQSGNETTQLNIKLVLNNKSNVQKVNVKKFVKNITSEIVDQPKDSPLPSTAESSVNALDNVGKEKAVEKRKLSETKDVSVMTKKPRLEQTTILSSLKPVRFKQIEECVIKCDLSYVTGGNDKVGRCQCKNNGNDCGHGCLNRATRYECSKKCGMGENCKNRRFQNREYAKLECFDTEKKGQGVRALEPIPKGTFIIEYVGEIIDDNQHIKRAKRYAKDPRHLHFYVMTLTSNTYIDATKKGNMARYINHSCDPNAVTEKWTVDRRTRIGFFATRDIKAGEEIVFDYKFERFGKTAQKCYCGSSNCRGVIGVEAEGRKQPELEELNNQSDVDSFSCSDDNSSSDSDVEIESIVYVKESKSKEVEQGNDTKPAKEIWQNSSFNTYRIPKKAPVIKIEPSDSPVESPHSIQTNDSCTRSSQISELQTQSRRRKSRFGPVVTHTPKETDSLAPPKLIQIPVSNASCSNSSTSSTPSNPDNNGSSMISSTSINETTANYHAYQNKQNNRAKPFQRAYHAFAGVNQEQNFNVPPFSQFPPQWVMQNLPPPPYFMTPMYPSSIPMTAPPQFEMPDEFQFIITPPPPPC